MSPSTPEDNTQNIVDLSCESSAESAEAKESEVLVEDAFSKLQEELGAISDRYLRLGAEFENFKKRSERDRLSAIRFANEGLLTELLPVIDHLEHAVVAASAQASGENLAATNIVTGVKMVLKQFKDILAKAGLKEFNSLETPFNPNMHEALAERESPDHDSGVVVEEYQKGYMLNDRLVRPARVVVSKNKVTQ